MSRDEEQRRSRASGALPWMVLAVSLAATALVTWRIYDAARARDRARFHNAVQATQDRIHTRVEVYVNVLRGGASMIAALRGTVPTKDEFAVYVDRLRLTQFYPGIQGVGFSMRVPAAAKDSFESWMRSDVSPSFHIWPEQPRDEYHSIIYLEPLDRRNEAAIGYDMYTNPVRRAAMAAARDNGDRAASGKVTLVQEIDPRKQPGFLIYVPVYRGSTVPQSVAARRESLLGFVYAPFRADDLFQNLFGPGIEPSVAIAVYDGDRVTPAALLHASPSSDSPASRQMTTTSSFDAAGRRWTIVYTTRQQFEAGSNIGFAVPTGAGGVALSFIIFFVVRSQQRARRDAENTAADLRESETNLRAQTEILETLNGVGRVVSAELDRGKLVQTITDAATQLCGAQFGAFFYNVADSGGQSYLLYALSGVSREAFSEFPTPRNTPLFEPTFTGSGVVRSDDIRTDPRYGSNPPFHGLPAGHLPVVSYLAVPVISRSGRTIGGLFFGHSAEAMFTERHEKIVDGLATQAAIAMDNAMLYEQAQQANRAKDEFLATLSHELRTPMTAILGWSRLMTLGNVDVEMAKEAAESIHRSAITQAQLIDDVLDVSRVVTGKLRLRVEPADAVTIVEAAIETVRHAADAKGVVIRKRVPDRAPLTVDAGRLQQVVWNLLSNAIRFTPAGGTVTVQVERLESSLRIVVSDTGQGISAAFLRHVFEPFRQEDATATRQHSGLGLGLAIVRYLVEMHGGTIRAESGGLGQGATFTVELPVHVAAPAARPAGGTAPAPIRKESLPRLTGMAILVIDDDEGSRDFAAATIKSCGGNVLTAISADRAEELLRVDRVDAIVCDIAMPDRDGYSFLEALRSRPRDAALPVIAFTAQGRPEDRERALTAGFDAFLAKPVDPLTLAETIANVTIRRAV